MQSDTKEKFSDKQYQELLSAINLPCRFRIMTYNILSKAYDESQRDENRWQNRKSRIIDLITHDAPDILCCQELTPGQIDDLMQALKHEYGLYAPLHHQKDLANAELLGIFYRKQRFELKQSVKKELGKMYYWEEYKNYCYQYFIKTHLLDKYSGKEFIVYNTHADYLKPDVRLKLVEFLLEDAEKDALHYPTLIAGDFNTISNTLPDPYKISLTPAFDSSYLLQTITKNNFRNALDMVLIAHGGPMSSFTSQIKNLLPFTGIDPFGLLIDHIFVTPKKIKVLFHAVEPATVNGHFPSDHAPVIADVSIP